MQIKTVFTGATERYRVLIDATVHNRDRDIVILCGSICAGIILLAGDLPLNWANEFYIIRLIH